MVELLLTGGRIYSPSEPFADSLLIIDGRIAWIGQESAAMGSSAEIIDLDGALVTPGFVDAHVHATSSGMQLLALDLTEIRSLAQLLKTLEEYTRSKRGAPVVGHGWDETVWPEQRPPSSTEIDRATAGSVVYLSRIDVHSAVISSAAQQLVPHLASTPGWSESGLVKAQAHGLVRSVLLQQLQSGLMTASQDAFLDHCLAHGITSIHECGGPDIAGEADFISIARRAKERGIDLVRYWGEAGEQGVARAQDLQADGVGGDLFIDGSIGSRTAALREQYEDDQSSGNLYLNQDQVIEHLRLATAAGLQAGFHAIGDRALATISAALREINDPSLIKGMRHRIEHVEMLDSADFALWRENGIVASVQPLFDHLWAGAMYPTRLGVSRSSLMNRFASMSAAGMALAFGSDSPVTRSSPWEWVRAAMYHSQRDERLTARAAFTAATRGGRRAAKQDDHGVIAVGAPADLAIWQVDQLAVQTPDARIAAWSTDERSGTPELPVLDFDLPLPICRATIVAGRVVYRA